MRSGTWNGRSTTDNVRVTVNGTVRPVKDVSIQSGMKDGHPAAETSSWCIEATIEWADPKTVTADSPHPFGAGTDWMPRDGDEVVVETGDGALGQWFVQHRGVIDSTSGSIADGTAVSRTVDAVEELNKGVQYVALLSRMTPVQDGEPFRFQGLQGIWYVDRMLRDEEEGARGWHTTPPVTPATYAAATGMGSLRPEVGTLLRANRRGDETLGPQWRIDGDGRPYPAEYRTLTTFRDSLDTRMFVLTLAIPDTATGDGYVTVSDSSGDGPTVGVNGVGDLYWRHHGQPNQYAPINGARRVSVAFERVSATDQRMTVRVDDGREFVHNTTTGTLPSNWRADRVGVYSGDAIGWWILEDEEQGSQRWASLEFAPTADIRINNFTLWDASPDQPRGAAAESIAAQLEAECAAAWLDEDSNFQWRGRDYLDVQASAQTVTSSLAVDDVAWETRRIDGARSVTIRYQQPLVEVDGKGDTTRDLWTQDNLDVGPGETETVSVTVPSGEDWIAEDLTPTLIDQWGLSSSAYTRDSHYGGTQYRAADSDGAAWATLVGCTMTKTGLRDYVVTFEALLPVSSTDRIKSDYPPAPTTTTARPGASPLVMRGRARTVWRERLMKAGTVNTAGGPRYVHDVEWRVQHVGVSMDNLRSWLVRELGNPKPTVSVTVAHDPRRQIGDKIRVEDRDVTGAWVEMLVQERDISVGGFTDVVRGRVTASGDLTDVTLLAPRGATPTTPTTTWNREVA